MFWAETPIPVNSPSWVDFIVATRDVETATTAFLTSPGFESQALTFRDYVTILYRALLGRDPDSLGLLGWEKVLREALLEVINGFISSTEFQNRLPQLCAPPSITVSVSPNPVTVQPGASQQFSATISGSSNTNVVWRVNWLVGGNAVVGTMSANGLYTAPGTVPYPGVVSIIANSVADSTISGAAGVQIPGFILVGPP